MATTPIKLTSKQRIFCEEYCIDFNATRAAKAARYSEKTAYAIGVENLKKPQIKEYIKEYQSDLSAACGISAMKVLNEYKKMAFTNITDVFDLVNIPIKDEKGRVIDYDQKISLKDGVEKVSDLPTNVQDAIAEMQQTKEGLKVKMHSKDNALAAISKMLGFNAAEKLDATVGVDGTIADLFKPQK